MTRSRFNELLDNVREAVDIQAGKKAPERVYVHPTLDVKAIRAKLDLSQDKFAALLGISRRTLEGWEQGRRKPTGAARQLLRVANRFPNAVYEAIFDLPSITAQSAGQQEENARTTPARQTGTKRSHSLAVPSRPGTKTGIMVQEKETSYTSSEESPAPKRAARAGARSGKGRSR